MCQIPVFTWPIISNSVGVALPSRFIAFFDECGDHSLTKIDPDFPLFVLAMVVVERDAYRDEVLPRMNSFKLRYWNHEGINLHSRDIRLAQGPFSILLNSQVRSRFMAEVSGLMESLPFTLFVTAIRKSAHVERHGAEATNPYDLALEFTLERLLHFMESHGETLLPVVAEARGRKEDNSLEQVFYRILSRGTENTPGERFRRLDCPLAFQSKKNNIVGVQLADLSAYSCARHILNPIKPNRAFDIVRQHFHLAGDASGWTIFPSPRNQIGASGFRQRAPTDRAFSVLFLEYPPYQKLQRPIAMRTSGLFTLCDCQPEQRFHLAHVRHPDIASIRQD